MLWAAKILTAFVAVEHIGFLAIEMFAWERFGAAAFEEKFIPNDEVATVLAGNMGLYNGFLAAGLLWGLKASEPAATRRIVTFFLVCIVIAGAYGGYSVKLSVFLAQAVPAAIALALWWIPKHRSA